MDLQRSLLIGAIAVLSFMLLTEWVAFKEERAAVPEEASRLISRTDAPTSELPEPGAEINSEQEDLPTVTMEQDEAAAQVSSDEIANANGSIVQVYTDVLQLAIDLRGGDIVEVALPKYLA